MVRVGLALTGVWWLATGCIFPLPNAPTPGAVTFVQAANGHATSSTLSLSFNQLSTPGNAIVVALRWQPSTAPSPQVSDSLRNAYQVAIPPVNGVRTTSNDASEMLYATDISAGGFPLAISVMKPDATYLEAVAVEYLGMASTVSVDTTAVFNSGGTPDINETIATTSVRDLLVGWVVSTSPMTVVGPGFVGRDAVGGDLLEDEVAPIPGNYAASATPNAPDWIFLVSAFRASLSSQ
jgi:hypothetical protein